MKEKTIFHIDVNNAFLSWEAVERLKEGEEVDLRKIAAVVGGDQSKRRGIVLAKSDLCKKCGIKTGETLYQADKKCKGIISVPPRMEVYEEYSEKMFNFLQQYSDRIYRYSIDEVFMDMTNIVCFTKPLIEIADEIRERIYKELGFTVCVGVSSNKLLAKMATDLRKPNFTTTLYPWEIEKMWDLPVGDLFMVGRSTQSVLLNLGIDTIGKLAKTDINILTKYFKSHGKVISDYANGIEDSAINQTDNVEREKGIGNSTTTSKDIYSLEEADKVLLYLCDKVCTRARKGGYKAEVITVHVKSNEFKHYSHQHKVKRPTNCTTEVYAHCKELIREMWKNEPLRHLGVRATSLIDSNIEQIQLFEDSYKKMEIVDETIDKIRIKYGKKSICRASLY